MAKVPARLVEGIAVRLGEEGTYTSVNLDVESLVRHTTAAGLPVQLRVEGEPRELAASVDVTAYRVAQEGLAAALEEFQKAPVEVHTREWRERA